MLFAGVLCLDGGGIEYGSERLHFGKRHYLLIMAVDFVEKLPSVYDCTLCIAAEVCTVQKNNNRDEGVLRQAEKIGQSLYVGVVLLDRIAEMVSIAVHVLRPLVRCFVTVYPACVISSL